ncbi:hypothetical protein CRUP_010245 [Coryphaenoides rupestris]|nr:hypothetical protein CRUP_010245 [Coryphaenoides rupestris]
MNSDCQSGALSSSVGTSKCSSPACMARRGAAHWGGGQLSRPGMQYGDSYDSLRDSPHSDRYVSALTTPARLSPVEFHYTALPPQSTGSLPSSPYRLPDDEAYETTQEYASSREPIRSRRRPRRSRLNGHVSQRAAGGLRDYSSQSFSQSEEECGEEDEHEEGEDEEDEEDEEDGRGESTPFLSMQNMSMEPAPVALAPMGYRLSSGGDTRTHRAPSRGPGARSNGQSRGGQRSKTDHMHL